VYDVIITGSVVYTGGEVLREGYVYIKSGRIVDVGEGPVPEDYTYATLVLGGPHRVITPGLAVAADVATYNYRLLKPSARERGEILKRTSRERQFLASLFGVYELHLSGATTILVESLDASLVRAIEEAAGGFYGVAMPACWGAPLPGDIAGVRVDLEGCEGGGVDWREILYFENRLAYSPIGEHDVWVRSMKLRQAAGLAGGTLKEGERAEVAVYDARLPPLAFIESNPEAAVLAPTLGARVESLIAGDEVLVDAGQHLNISPKQLADALAKLLATA